MEKDGETPVRTLKLVNSGSEKWLTCLVRAHFLASDFESTENHSRSVLPLAVHIGENKVVYLNGTSDGIFVVDYVVKWRLLQNLVLAIEAELNGKSVADHLFDHFAAIKVAIKLDPSNHGLVDEQMRSCLNVTRALALDLDLGDLVNQILRRY